MISILRIDLCFLKLNFPSSSLLGSELTGTPPDARKISECIRMDRWISESICLDHIYTNCIFPDNILPDRIAQEKQLYALTVVMTSSYDGVQLLIKILVAK